MKEISKDIILSLRQGIIFKNTDSLLLNNSMLSVVFMGILLLLLFLGLGFTFLVLIGNLAAMKLLAKNGVAVFCRKIDKDYELLNYVNKDGVGWLHIPGIVYAPIMDNNKGFYKTHNFLKKPSYYGEIYLANSTNSKGVNSIRQETRGFKDLTIIEGSAKGKQVDPRHANFTSLRKVIQLIDTEEVVKIRHSEGLSEYNPIAIIETSKGENDNFEYKDREVFIESLLSIATKKAKEIDKTRNIVILRYKTEIDTMLVLLSKKGE